MMNIKVYLKSFEFDNRIKVKFVHKFLNLSLPNEYSVVDDWVMIIIERGGPSEQDGPTGNAGDHGPVGWGLRGVLHNKLDRAGVQAVVDEAVVHPSVLHSDWSKLQAVPVLVQGAPE